MKESITLKDVFAISEKQAASGIEAKDRWTKIGVGFVNRDNSINVVLDALPINGRFQIRDRQARPIHQPTQSSQSSFRERGAQAR